MSRETIYVDKAYEKWTLEEKLKGVDAVFRYLKYDGLLDPLHEEKRTFTTKDGRKIQHVQQFITNETDSLMYGFFDEIVYVLGRYTHDPVTSDMVYEGKHFMGMHWAKSVDARLTLLDSLHVDDIRSALFATMMHEAIRR